MFNNLEEARKLLGKKAEGVSDQRIINYLYDKEVVSDPTVEMDYLEYNKMLNPNENSFGSISKFKEAFTPSFPELKDMSPYDIGVFAHKYAKTKGTNVKFKDFYESFNPVNKNVLIGLTSVPVENLDFRPVTGAPNRSLKDIQEELNYGTEDVPILNEIRLKQGFAEDEQDQKKLAERELSNVYGKPIEVTIDELSGEYVFENPESGKKQFINKPGLDVGDFLSLGGDGIYLAGDALGRIAGTALAGPVGNIAGAGLGSAYGDALRLAIGHRYFGTGDQKQNEEDLAKSFGMYLQEKGQFDEVNALIETAGMTIPGFYRFATKLAKAGKMDSNDFKNQVKESEESLEILDDFNNRLADLNSKKKLKFTLGQASGDSELLAKQRLFETNSNYGERGRFEEFGKDQADALNTYFKLIKGPFSRNQINGSNDFAEENLENHIRQNIIKPRQDPIRKAMIRRMENSEKNLRDEVVRLPDGTFKEEGENIRTILDEIDADAFKQFKNRYIALSELGKGRKINTDEINKVFNSLNSKDKLSLVKKKIGINDLLKKPGKQISLDEIKATRTDLLELERQMGRLGEVGPKGFPRNILDAIDVQIKKDLKDDDPWLQEYTEISNDYKAYKQKFGGIVNKLLEKKNGRLVIADEDVFKQTFKPDSNMGQARRMDEIISVLEENPANKELYGDAILSFYKENVLDAGGNFNRKAHKKFIDEYKGSLEKFFSPQEMQKIKNIDGLTNVVENIKRKNENLENLLRKSSFGQIDSLDPEQMFEKSFVVDKPITLTRMMRVLKKDDEALKAYQNQVHNFMYKKITDNRGNFNFDKFKNFMKSNGKKFDKVFANNPQYLKDLKTFEQALERTSREASGVPQRQVLQTFVDWLRGSVFGTFSKSGRIFSAAVRTFGAQMDKQMADIMLDPERLKTLMSLSQNKSKEKALKGVVELFKLPIKTESQNEGLFGGAVIETLGEAFEESDDTSPPQKEEKKEEFRIVPEPTTMAPTVDMFAMQPPATQPASRPKVPTPPPAQQGIAAMQPNRAQQYAGLFPNDPSGQMIAQGKQNA